MGTFANEDLLPKVPLPTLEDSCRRFLSWCAPLLTEAELAETEAAVAQFSRSDGPGPILHAALEQYAVGPGVRSWLDTFWPSRYLGRRDRIALNANFFFLLRDEPGFQDEPGEPARAQLRRAAGLVAAAVDIKVQLDAEQIPPMVVRGQAQSMVQHKYLFSATRIPGRIQDTARVPYSEQWPGPSQARHIVVFHRGNAVRMEVIGADGAPHRLPELEAALVKVMQLAAAPGPGVGRLTTKARAEWAESRDALLAAHPGNVQALDEVETALFGICLVDGAPADQLAVCDQLLHGDAANRWFDKAVSLIVFGDGTAGINVEHCELDGTTVLSLVDAMLSSSPEEHSRQSGAREQGPPAVQVIEFRLDDKLRADLQAAGESFAAFAAGTASALVSFPGFGTDQAKRLGMSPDAFVQLAYQLAHRRARGFTGATYESIATRQYQNGRTEAMRVVTPQVLGFVAAMDDPRADKVTRVAALRAAAEQHVQRVKECQAGQAPEQHLWELQLIAQRRGAELGVPEALPLYDTPGWRIMRHDFLSTSSAPSASIEYFGFGSTSSRCIGVGYVLLPDRWHIYLSASRPVAAEMHAFAGKLREAVAELQSLFSDHPAG